MPAEVRELRVFMASPGDLESEREALRQIERRLNALFRNRGVRVSIEGWEEVQPDFGRPQALINPLVHECEVFIGLLHARWGTATGTHSSGFEEEFELALARRAQHGEVPAIGMFFRTLESDRLTDPGPQLAAVLAFQERVRQERLAMYKTFDSADQLALEIFEFLAPYAFDMADAVAKTAKGERDESGSVPGAADQAGATPSLGVEADSSDAADPGDAARSREAAAPLPLDQAQEQIVDSLRGFADVFTTETKDFDPQVRDRVTLIGTAFAKDPDLLGGHHVNRLYQRRAQLHLTLAEARAWYRTHFANVGMTDRDGRTIPIWGAVGPRRKDGAFNDELGLLAADSNLSVARGTLRFMRAHGIRPQAYWPNPESDPLVAPDDEHPLPEGGGGSIEQVVNSWVDLLRNFGTVDIALDYIAAVGTQADVPLLRAIAAADELGEERQDAISALANVLSGDLGDCEALAPPTYSGDDTATVQRLLVDVMPRLESNQWRALLTGTAAPVTSAAALQLASRDESTDDEFELIVGTKNADVLNAVVERARDNLDWALPKVKLLRSNRKSSHGDLISRLLAASTPSEELEKSQAGEQLSAATWVARAIQDPELLADEARQVLDGLSEFVNTRVEPLRGEYDLVADHLDTSARAGACAALGALAAPTDDDFVRVTDELRRDHYISRTSAAHALIEMAKARINSGGALPDLGDLGVLDDHMPQADVDAFLHSPLADVLVPSWRMSDVTALRESARTWLLQRPEASDEELEDALYADVDTRRVVAVDALIARWDRTRLEELLDRYDKQDRAYWYNVIAALDEHLYGYASAPDADPTGRDGTEPS